MTIAMDPLTPADAEVKLALLRHRLGLREIRYDAVPKKEYKDIKQAKRELKNLEDRVRLLKGIEDD